MIGLKRGIVKLMPYDDSWRKEFEREKERLKKVLGDKEWWRTLAFQDYLRKYEDWARKYSDLKSELARKFKGDREAYLGAKTQFVEKVLKRLRTSTSPHSVYMNVALLSQEF